MFDLLTNVLIWVVAAPIIILAYRRIPRDWFKTLGLIIFLGIVVVGFVSFDFAERWYSKLILDFLSFPFTVTGFVLLMLFSVAINPKKGDKPVSKKIWLAFLILAIASNNGISDLLVSYLEKQGESAVIQAYRRPALDLTQTYVNKLRQPDAIVVTAGATIAISPLDLDRERLPSNDPGQRPWTVQLTDTGDRLIYAAKFWQERRSGNRPIIILSGSAVAPTKFQNVERPQNYPCGIPPERSKQPVRTKRSVRDDIAQLAYDPRYDSLFPVAKPGELVPSLPNAAQLEKFDVTMADDMCTFLTQILTQPPMQIPRSAIAIDPYGSTIRKSVIGVSNIIDKLLERRKFQLPEEQQNRPTILLIATALETSRAFLAFRHEDLDVIPFPSNYIVNPLERPWPVYGGVKGEVIIKPSFFFFSAESFWHTERAWDEVKQLILYTLRFWMQPPITDQQPYYAPEATTAMLWRDR